MPVELPSFTQRATPSAQNRSALSYRGTPVDDRYSGANIQTPNLVTRGAEALGQGLSDAGEGLHRKQERERNERATLETAAAKSYFTRELLRIEGELEKRPDYEKHEELYEQEVTKARDNAVKMVEDPIKHELLGYALDEVHSRGQRSLQSTVHQKSMAAGRVLVEDTLKSNQDALMNTRDENTREALLDASRELIEGGVNKGYYSDVEAFKVAREFHDNYVIGRAALLPPAEAATLLAPEKDNTFKKTGTWIDRIPPGQRMKLWEKANVEDDKIKGQAATDIIVAEGGTLKEQLEKARKIKDPDIRDNVVTRVKTRFNEDQTISAAASKKAIEDTWLDIEKLVDEKKGQEALDIIPDSMPHAEREKMKAYIQSPTTETDWGYYEELSNMEPDELVEEKVDITRLSPAHRKQFIDDQAEIREGKVPVIGDVAGLANEYMDTVGIKSKKDRGLFRNKLRLEIEEEARAKGKDTLSFEEKQKIMDRMTMEVRFKKLGPDKKTKLFQLEGDEDFSKVVVPDDMREKILKAVQAKAPNRAVTEDEIKEIYIRTIK